VSSRRVFLHRYVSWVLVAVSLLTIASGYIVSKGLFVDYTVFSYVHRVFEIVFIGVFVFHVGYTLWKFKLDLRTTAGKVGKGKTNSIHLMRLVQRFSSWFIVIAAFGMILTGLNGYYYFATTLEDVVPFAPHRVFDVLLVTSIIVHVVIGIRFALMRRRVNTTIAKRMSISIAMILLVVTFTLNIPTFNPGSVVINEPLSNRMIIDAADFVFDPEEITTVRPDIFRPGSFSLFDVLVYFDTNGDVDLEYHFDDSMNTHVIDSLNGEPYWWYFVEYSGGWGEANVYRMDHYQWKHGTKLRFTTTKKDRLDGIYASYREEVQRLASNNGVTIMPEVNIHGISYDYNFYDIAVTPHNIRNDTFQDGVLTAIDVIMTLGDLGLITYELQWYDTIGDASYVRSYWVDSINNLTSAGTCGFVYDTGSWEYHGFGGNHIHLPSDVNILNSPDYMRWFWICI
jgi:succinate dehydrogenase/fumarate reductase cytochrome b subunit